MSKNVLITGANGGFGRLTARTLLAAGHTVVATVRDVETRNLDAANELRAAGAHVVELDVTDDASVDAAVRQAVQLLGSIDVVVNNAGVGSIGLLETFTSADWQKVFEVNVFGVQRVNRAVLPFMRERGSGLLVIVSSVVGRMSLPFFGPYNAAKFAVEGMAETYRSELSNLGIQTCVVEPGAYPTSFIDALIESSDRSRDQSYGDMVHAPRKMIESFEGVMAANPGQDPQNVANAILALIDSQAAERRFRTVVDGLGMADAVDPLNDAAERVTAGIYGAFGIAGMLEVATDTQ